MNKSTVVQMTGVTKRFPGVIANNNVHFQIRCGEIHALLGENGAGKSTLMSILTGLYRPDEGEITVKGSRVHFRSPREAIAAGIGMVHQHFRLVKPLSVAENIILGSEKGAFWLDKKKIRREIEGLSSQYGLAIDAGAKIWQLSVGEQQRVEIVKILYRGSDILILDEPTAVLTPQESCDLFAILRRMADDGKAVVVITHKMHEVMEMADRVTVLRAGATVATLDRSQATQAELARLMVGRDIVTSRNSQSQDPGRPLIQLEKVRALNDKGLPGLQDISLQVRGGEIVAVAGVAGNGQRELVEVMTGLRPVSQGKVTVDGRDFTGAAPGTFIDAGVSLVPEDRLGMGLVPNLSIVDNILLKKLRRLPGWLIPYAPLRQEAETIVRDFEIKTTHIDAPVKLMSGGNLQKLLMAREISNQPQLMVTVYPVRGLDIGATEAVRALLLKERQSGAGIFLISEDLDEILLLADRILVLFEGRVMGELLPRETSKEELGLLMTGIVRRGEGEPSCS